MSYNEATLTEPGRFRAGRDRVGFYSKLAARLVLSTCLIFLPALSRGAERRNGLVAVELQVNLLSLELPASRTDRSAVDAAIAEVARKGAFQVEGRPGDPLWTIQRMYIGPHYASIVLSLFPEHTIVTLAKRPGDHDSHQDAVDALNAAFRPLGFTPWVEPPE